MEGLDKLGKELTETAEKIDETIKSKSVEGAQEDTVKATKAQVEKVEDLRKEKVAVWRSDGNSTRW